MGHNRPRVIAHRGYAADNPENTVAAMSAAAADSRTDSIEIDARATRDGRVIVFHDDDLSRLTDAPPAVSETPVWELSYAKLSEYTIGDTDESIPLLEDVLAAIPESIGVNIELKHPGRGGLQFGAVDDADAREAAADRWQPFVERALGVATDTDHDLLVSSFYEGALAAARSVAPAVPRAPLVTDSTQTALVLADRYTAAAIHPPIDLLSERPARTPESGELPLEMMQTAGYPINAWTATTQAQAVTLDQIGVDGIIADTLAILPSSW